MFKCLQRRVTPCYRSMLHTLGGSMSRIETATTASSTALPSRPSRRKHLNIPGRQLSGESSKRGVLVGKGVVLLLAFGGVVGF